MYLRILQVLPGCTILNILPCFAIGGEADLFLINSGLCSLLLTSTNVRDFTSSGSLTKSSLNSDLSGS